MRKFIIYQENNEPISFSENIDEDEIEDYKQKFRSLFNYSNISELETTNKFILIRPSKINCIVIKKDLNNENSKDITLKNENIEENDEENVITDGE